VVTVYTIYCISTTVNLRVLEFYIHIRLEGMRGKGFKQTKDLAS
jgi:hypothetical protein